MVNRAFVIVPGAAVALMLAAAVGAAAQFQNLEFIRFSVPVGLPGVTLVAGEYAFEVAHLDGFDQVRVRYRRSHRISFAGPTVRITRPRGAPLRQSILLGPARPGAVAPILVWFPIDELVGYQFIYASDAAEVAAARQVVSAGVAGGAAGWDED